MPFVRCQPVQQLPDQQALQRIPQCLLVRQGAPGQMRLQRRDRRIPGFRVGQRGLEQQLLQAGVAARGHDGTRLKAGEPGQFGRAIDPRHRQLLPRLLQRVGGRHRRQVHAQQTIEQVPSPLRQTEGIAAGQQQAGLAAALGEGTDDRRQRGFGVPTHPR